MDTPRITLTTSLGTMVVELFPETAPETVANFLAYVDAGFYNGTIFHRVIPGFMAQGGGFTPEMEEKPTRSPIPNEANAATPNLAGTLAMARTMEPHSATAQFFINLVDNGYLDHRDQTPQGFGYCVFGKVVEGFETVQAIAEVPTTSMGFYDDVPVEPVRIESATRVTEE